METLKNAIPYIFYSDCLTVLKRNTFFSKIVAITNVRPQLNFKMSILISCFGFCGIGCFRFWNKKLMRRIGALSFYMTKINGWYRKILKIRLMCIFFQNLIFFKITIIVIIVPYINDVVQAGFFKIGKYLETNWMQKSRGLFWKIRFIIKPAKFQPLRVF